MGTSVRGRVQGCTELYFALQPSPASWRRLVPWQSHRTGLGVGPLAMSTVPRPRSPSWASRSAMGLATWIGRRAARGGRGHAPNAVTATTCTGRAAPRRPHRLHGRRNRSSWTGSPWRQGARESRSGSRHRQLGRGAGRRPSGPLLVGGRTSARPRLPEPIVSLRVVRMRHQLRHRPHHRPRGLPLAKKCSRSYRRYGLR